MAKANEDLGQQRDAIRRREANLTFDKALDLCNNGTIAEGLHWMVRSLEIDPAMSPAFEKLVRTNLASWGHHKIQLVRQLPHPNTVWSVSMSPKGDVFATACFDGGVRIWDCQSFALKAEFKEAIGCELRNLDFSPDGTKLAVALGLTRRTAEGTEQSKGALMWNLTTTPPKTILLDSTETILTVRFSHDGKTMATGGGVEKERTIRLWDATADVARLLNEVTLPRRREIAFTFSSDDKSLIIASHAGEIYRWNVDEPKVITLPQTHFAKTGVRWVEVSPDGKTMATCGDDFAVRFWDVESGEPKASPLMHRQILYSEKYTPDGRGIIVCSGASAVTLWDVFRGEKIEQLDLGAPAQVAVHPEGEFFVTGSMEGNVQVWRFPRCESVSRPHEVKQITRLNTGQWENTAAISANQQKIASRESSGQKALRLWDVSGDPLGPKLDFPIDVVSDVAFSPDGRYLAASGWRTDGTVRGHLAVWDIQEDPPKRRIFTHSNYVKTLAFHPNGRTLAAGDYHHFVRFWDLETGMEASEPIRETDIVLKIAYNGDGKTLAVGTARDRRGKPHLQFWNADTCERVGEPILHPASVTTLAFSPDFKSLFTGGIGNPVQLWDADSHQPLGKPLPMPDAFESLAFSSNGKTFALGNSNGVVQIYRSSDSEPQSKNFDHPHPPRALAFHPSGQQLLVGCGDGTIWLWDIETQRQLGPPVVHSQEIIRVAFLADGAGFLTVAGDGSVRRWRSPVPTPHDLPTLKRRVELLTSKSMAADGEINLIPSEAWEKLRKELIAHQGTDETSLAKPLSSREWHDARARDARQDNDAFAEQWHSVRRNRSK